MSIKNLFSAKRKPGFLRRLFIYKRIEWNMNGRMALLDYLSKVLEEKYTIKYSLNNLDYIHNLLLEERKIYKKLKELEEKNKKLYFKLR